MFSAVVVTVAHSFSLLFYHCVHHSCFQLFLYCPSAASKKHHEGNNYSNVVFVLDIFPSFPIKVKVKMETKGSQKNDKQIIENEIR